MTYVKPWLKTAGKFTVEQIPCPHFSQPVNLAGPRTGVLHTTEGHWNDGLAVFKQHFAPHFMVGEGRIAQLVPIGVIGAALVHHNADAIIQIEVVSFSSQKLWLPDQATVEALAALMSVCQHEYGIPLMHPWPDGDYGHYGDNPHRHAGKWGVTPGWFGHGDVPLPDSHWDPGALQWSKLFEMANVITGIAPPPAVSPGASPTSARRVPENSTMPTTSLTIAKLPAVSPVPDVPAPSVVVPRVTPTVLMPVRIAWGDLLEQFLSNERVIIEALAVGGEQMAVHMLPFGSMIDMFLGPATIKGYVDLGLTALGVKLETMSTNIAPDTIMATIANLITGSLPAFTAYVGPKLNELIAAELAKLGINVGPAPAPAPAPPTRAA